MSLNVRPGDPGDLVTYRLDEQDRIVEVNEAWDRFARANEGDSALGELVIGTRLFEHITSDATRFLIEAMLQCVRASGESLTRCYRCDSPGIRRTLDMTLVPEQRGRVLLEHRVRSIEMVSPAIRFRPVGEWAGAVKRCSLCNRVRVGNTWSEPEAASERGALDSTQPVKVYYGVCPSCRPSYGVS
jgi:hypothetical protein